MRVLTQQIMNRLFEVTDEVPVDREAIVVPLEMRGDGEVRRTSGGRFEIVLPDRDDLEPFLARLPGRLRELGAGGANGEED